MSEDEVTRWLDGLARGDERAVQEIWRQYFAKLVRLARSKLAQGARREADEEDVALSAFHEFCQRAREGRFPQLEDRNDLWRLLITITTWKASHQVRRAMQQKRGSGLARGESVFGGNMDDDAQLAFASVLGSEPTPELAAMAAEECQRLLEVLPDDQLRSIALWKLEGYTNYEIAEKIPCTPRTVERKLRRIRDFWEQAVDHD